MQLGAQQTAPVCRDSSRRAHALDQSRSCTVQSARWRSATTRPCPTPPPALISPLRLGPACSSRERAAGEQKARDERVSVRVRMGADSAPRWTAHRAADDEDMKIARCGSWRGSCTPRASPDGVVRVFTRTRARFSRGSRAFLRVRATRARPVANPSKPARLRHGGSWRNLIKLVVYARGSDVILGTHSPAPALMHAQRGKKERAKKI